MRAALQLLSKSKQTYENVCVRCETISNLVLQQAEDTKGVLDLRVRAWVLGWCVCDNRSAACFPVTLASCALHSKSFL